MRTPLSARCARRERSGDGWMADHTLVAEDDVDLSRRKFLTRATIATGAVGAAFAAVPFIESWKPSERARALGVPDRAGSLQARSGPDGHHGVAQAADLCRASAHRRWWRASRGTTTQLKDPSSGQLRPAEVREERAALAHAGVPGADRRSARTSAACPSSASRRVPELCADWPGGFFCPCHGSRFDLAGPGVRRLPRLGQSARAAVLLSRMRSTLVIGVDEKGIAS